MNKVLCLAKERKRNRLQEGASNLIHEAKTTPCQYFFKLCLTIGADCKMFTLTIVLCKLKNSMYWSLERHTWVDTIFCCIWNVRQLVHNNSLRLLCIIEPKT